jgi:outer membrane protein assembly factor BamB
MNGLRTLCRACLLSAAFAGLVTAPLAALNWPQWRGPAGQGVSAEMALPTDWSPTTRVAWKTALSGRGHSAPVVWGDRVFVTTAVEGEPVPGRRAPQHMDAGKPFLHPDSVGVDRRHALKVIALDAATGRVVWERVSYDGPMFDNRHKRGSYASATPVTDGERVYVYFGPEGVYAYDFAGTLAWTAGVGKIKTLGLGVGASPILYRNLLILQCDENTGADSFIVALDTQTGKEVWRTKRDVQVSWSTPVLIDVPAEPSGKGSAEGRSASTGRPRTELVTNGTEWIIGYDPATGRELWRATGVRSNAIHTPLVGEGLVIVTAGYPERRVIAIRPGGTGDVSKTDRVAWTYDKGTAYVVSPILYRGLVYLLNDRGVMTALEAATGQVVYEGGRIPKPATFMGSPVAFGDYLLLTSEDGETFFVRAGPAHEVVKTNSVDEPVYSTLALANGRIFIRGERHVFAIQ